MVHLVEEGTDKKGGAESEDTDDNKGVNEEFIVHLARACERCSPGGEMLLPLQQPGTFYLQMPISEGI